MTNHEELRGDHDQHLAMARGQSTPSIERADVQVCRNPIFIIGSPRSGTSVLARSLQRHSHLWYSIEGQIFSRLFGPHGLDKVYAFGASRDFYWIGRQRVTREEFLETVGIGFNALYTSRSGSKRWIEKTPANSLMAEVLADMFPGASFLHILRDGRSVVHSMIHKPNTRKWANDFGLACSDWVKYARAAMKFSVRRPERCLTVRHGELVADPENSFHRIFRFIEVPNEEAPAAHFRSRRINSSFTDRLANDRIDPWAEWTREQKRIFLGHAGPAMLEWRFITEEELRRLEADAGS